MPARVESRVSTVLPPSAVEGLAPLLSSEPKSAPAWFRAWGPAWLVMIADVDAASILTSVESGVAFHYDHIWFLLLIVPLFFIQEAAGRIGAVTGKGLGELVRQHGSRRLAVVLAGSVAVADVASYVAEYAAIGLGLGILGVPLVLSLPVAFVVHIGLVARGRYVWVERVLLAVSAVFIATVGAALWMHGVLPYTPVSVSANPSFVFLLAANAGAVVMPFMLFYQTSATAEKAPHSTVPGVRRETLIGAIASELLMVAFLMLGAGMPASANLFTSSGLAAALASVGGDLLANVFALGLVAAAFLALVVISLGSAWGVVEALGLPRRSAFWVYTAESVPAVVVPFVYPHPLSLVLLLMVLFVFILIGPGILVGFLSANRRVMGPKASHGLWRAAYWTSLGAVVLCGVLAVA